MKYLMSGGGGAPLYPIEHPAATMRKAESAYHFVEVTLTGDALRLVAHRLRRTTLESCGFTRGNPWDCDAKPRIDTPAFAAAPALAQETPSTTSRCGCALPGAPAGFGAAAWLALGGAGAAVARRRRG